MRVDETTIYRLLKRHEWRKLVPRPFHPKADKEEQRLFRQNFEKLVEEAIKSRDPEDERPVLTMAQDEACFGRISTIRRSWAPKHIRPLTPRQVVREYIYVYAVIALEEGKMTSLLLPSADTSMMNLFLKHVSHTFFKYFLVIQVDQAGWQSSKDLVIPEESVHNSEIPFPKMSQDTFWRTDEIGTASLLSSQPNDEGSRVGQSDL